MVASDFVGLVQLGVGLHIGSALLQIYGDLGLQPVERPLSSARYVLKDSTLEGSSLDEKLARIEDEYEKFKIRFSVEYRALSRINSLVAIALLVILILISFYADYKLSHAQAIGLTAFTVLPGLYTLLILWVEASKRLSDLRREASNVEDEVLKAVQNEEDDIEVST